MICPKCNYNVDNTANFCHNCGYRFPKENFPPAQYVPQNCKDIKFGNNTEQENNQRYEKSVELNNQRVEKMHWGKYILLGIVGSFVILLLIIIILSFFA